MSLLIAIKSCWKDKVRGCHEDIRRTWGQDVHPYGDLIFFVGHFGIYDTNEPFAKLSNDVVRVVSSDDYDSLPFKTLQILEYSLEHNYDYTFLCDIDTYIIPHLLAKCGYEKYDYCGRFGTAYPIGTTFRMEDDRRNIIPVCHPWASGGVGYFLSRKATQIVVDSDPNHWAEDLFVGQSLGPYIQSGHIKAGDLQDFEAQISWHFSRKLHQGRVYDPSFKWLDKMYSEHK